MQNKHGCMETAPPPAGTVAVAPAPALAPAVAPAPLLLLRARAHHLHHKIASSTRLLIWHNPHVWCIPLLRYARHCASYQKRGLYSWYGITRAYSIALSYSTHAAAHLQHKRALYSWFGITHAYSIAFSYGTHAAATRQLLNRRAALPDSGAAGQRSALDVAPPAP